MRLSSVSAFLAVLLLFIACSSSGPDVRSDASVRLFTAMSDGNITITQTTFSGADAAAISDLVRAECPTGVTVPFTRAVITGRGGSFVVYAANGSVACSLLKPRNPAGVISRPRTEAPSVDVALTVNGQPITYPRLQAAIDASGANATDQIPTVVAAVVTGELLRQEATGFTPTTEELLATRANVLAAAGISAEQAAALTEEQRVALDAQVLERARIDLLLRARLLLDEVLVPEAVAKEAYLANPNQFLQSEQAVARFILISSQGRTLSEGQARARTVIDLLPTTDFCALVGNYSDDAGSSKTCGVYVIPRGVLNADLEAAAFGTPIGKTAVVTTDAGVYLVQTLQVNPAGVVPYPQVSDRLRAGLRERVAQERLNLYVALLRADAKVVSYLE